MNTICSDLYELDHVAAVAGYLPRHAGAHHLRQGRVEVQVRAGTIAGQYYMM